MNAFAVLNLTMEATPRDLQLSYRTLAKQVHPDKVGGDTAHFQKLQAAYDILVEPTRKLMHFEELRPAQRGDVVRLQGLHKTPELNGLFGRADIWNGLRLVVKLAEGRSVSVRPENVSRQDAWRSVPVRPEILSWQDASSMASATASGKGTWASASSFAAGAGQQTTSSASAWTSASPPQRAPVRTVPPVYHPQSESAWASTSASAAARGGQTNSTASARASAANELEAQEGEVMKELPGFGMLPYCTLCDRWTCYNHRLSSKHMNNLVHNQHLQTRVLPKASPSHQTPSPQPAPSPQQPATAASPKPLSFLAVHAWTDTEMAVSAELVRDHFTAFDLWDSPGGIYSIFQAEPALTFRDCSENELLSEARVLQLALQTFWRSPALCALMQDSKQSGKGCMNTTIHAHDWTDNEKLKETYFVKTAGDMLQAYWVHQHLLDSRYHFGYNVCQADFAKWIWLPRCLLGEDLDWNTHGLADFCEAATLYLPAKVAHLYLQCLSNFHKLRWSHVDVPRCQHVDHTPCHKAAAHGMHFCRKHSADSFF